MNIYEKLSNIQNELKCNKNQFNKFGGYKYRSCEDILEAVKPICKKYKTVLILSDSICVYGEGQSEISVDKNGEDYENKMTMTGQRFYVQATARLTDIEANKENEDTCITNTAYAREEENKKGMDGSQITGTASSYARKYALNGLFNIDDTKDADTDEYTRQTLDEDKKITKVQADALYELIKNRDVEKDFVMATLADKGYSKLAEIKQKDYNNIRLQFEHFIRN